MYDAQAYEAQGFSVMVMRNAHARPRTLALGKAQKSRTRRAKKQYVPGHPPRELAAYSWR